MTKQSDIQWTLVKDFYEYIMLCKTFWNFISIVTKTDCNYIYVIAQVFIYFTEIMKYLNNLSLYTLILY